MQTRLQVPRIASLGHEVIIGAFWGLNGASTQWNGHLVLPGGQDPYGSDIIAEHARRVGADLVITLMDIWPLNADQVKAIRAQGIAVAHWMPVDCDRPRDMNITPGVGIMDENHLKATGAIPIAMSRFGQRKLAEAGIEALYVPHSIDTRNEFTPARRDETRKALGLGDRFTVGINAANKDAIRKGFPEALLAFARFRRRHPEALLLLHTLVQAPGALDLQALCNRLGIMDAVRWSDQYAYLTGMLQPQAMGAWASAADVGLHATYGEGFGLAAIEFQAAGTPVIITDATASTELAGPGWLVRGQEWWNMAHQNWWCKPLITHTCPRCGYEEGIDAALEAAWRAREDGTMPALREKSREFAVQYDADLVLEQYWKPVLETIAERVNAAKVTQIRPSAQVLHERMRDTVLQRLEAAHEGGVLDAGEFGRRSHRATVAQSGAELAALLADLPVDKVAA